MTYFCLEIKYIEFPYEDFIKNPYSNDYYVYHECEKGYILAGPFFMGSIYLGEECKNDECLLIDILNYEDEEKNKYLAIYKLFKRITKFIPLSDNDIILQNKRFWFSDDDNNYKTGETSKTISNLYVKTSCEYVKLCNSYFDSQLKKFVLCYAGYEAEGVSNKIINYDKVEKNNRRKEWLKQRPERREERLKEQNGYKKDIITGQWIKRKYPNGDDISSQSDSDSIYSDTSEESNIYYNEEDLLSEVYIKLNGQEVECKVIECHPEEMSLTVKTCDTPKQEKRKIKINEILY